MPVSAFASSHIVDKPLFESQFVPFHSNQKCFFARYPFRFDKQHLRDWNFISKLPNCTCFEFAVVHNCPDYQNLCLEEDDFLRMALNSGSFRLLGKTDVRYRLNDPGDKVYRDPWVKEALKEFDLSWYYSLKDKNKTPRPGHMYFALLAYCYPKKKPPSIKERHFWDCFGQATNFVFRNFDQVDVQSVEDTIFKMPKNTSAGWLSQFHFGKAMKKEDVLDTIKWEYNNMLYRIERRLNVSDFVVFAMRGHLSPRVKIKTRPVWLVSATTIVSELRYYQGFYDQLNNKKFFTDRVITGKKSMTRLRRFLLRDETLKLINTDISGWDSFRAAWFHERILRKAKSKVNFENSKQRLEFDFIIDQAIRTKILLPSGYAIQKSAGIISGTAGTLLFNTLLNMILTYTVLAMMKAIDFEFYVNSIKYENWLGDDFAFYLPRNAMFDFDKFVAMIFKYFDLVINKDKCIFATTTNDRKFLGYQLSGGLLYRPERELFSSVLYSERFLPWRKENIAISFSRVFSYLLIGGINNHKFLEFFYFYIGKFSSRLEKVQFIFTEISENVFKLLKDIWNIKISPFDVKTFQRMNLVLLKYVMFFDLDLITEAAFL